MLQEIANKKQVSCDPIVFKEIFPVIFSKILFFHQTFYGDLWEEIFTALSILIP